jgi:hypothetical protein
VTLLLDLIEEEFHADRLPFVRGRDRKALLNRALQKYFRTSDLRTVLQQGRDESGRKDMQVCVAGVSSTVSIKRWLEAIEARRVPLAGVVSLPLIGEKLLPLIRAGKQPVLLVSQQSPETLRQSFYDRGHLKLSRLAQRRMDGMSTRLDARHMRGDINNTVLFLKSQRLLHRNDSLEVCLIGPREQFAALEEALRGDDSLRCRVVDQVELARQVGVRDKLPTEFADGIFVQLLCKTRGLKNHYANWQTRRYYAYNNARKAMRGVTGLVLLAGAGITASNYHETLLYDDYAQRAQLEVRRYRDALSREAQQGARFNLPPDAIKATVSLVEHLETYAAASPLPIMGELAGVLGQHPNIDVSGLQWLTTFNENELPSLRAMQTRAEMDSRAERQLGAGVAFEEYEIARIDGSVVGYGDNYRRAVELFQRFAADLRDSELFDGMLVEKTPFDMNSESELSGDSGTAANTELRSEATFSLLVNRKRWSGDNEG